MRFVNKDMLTRRLSWLKSRGGGDDDDVMLDPQTNAVLNL